MTVDWRCKRRVAVEKGNDSSVTLASKLARIGIKMCSSFSRLGRGHGPLKIGDGAVPSAYIRDLIVFKKHPKCFGPHAPRHRASASKNGALEAHGSEQSISAKKMAKENVHSAGFEPAPEDQCLKLAP